MRIGILGGTFDPVHIGHLIIAEEARSRLDLERVIFVPAAISPFKTGKSGGSPLDRLKMVELATENNEYFSVSKIEIERGGISYTVDTLREMRRFYGRSAELFFIIGADAIVEIRKWKDPQVMLSECTLVAASRPGYSLENIEEFIPERTSEGLPASERLIRMKIPDIGISSTDIRERIATGRAFRYMVPERVWSYIMEMGLYRKSNGVV